MFWGDFFYHLACKALPLDTKELPAAALGNNNKIKKKRVKLDLNFSN